MTTRSPFWMALPLALPFAIAQMFLVVRGRARQALTEVSGAVALAALVPAIVLANGEALPYALALWLIPVIRAFTSILYIRVRLRRAHGDDADRIVPLVAHGVGALVLGAAWVTKLLPITALIALLMLTARAIYGLYWARIDTPTKQIGFQEIAVGLLMVPLVVSGR